MAEKTYAITVRMTEAELLERKNALVAERNTLYLRLESNGEDIAAVERALRGIRAPASAVITSESNPAQSYLVSKGATGFTCTCPSYNYGAGLDAAGHCKHIRKAIGQGELR